LTLRLRRFAVVLALAGAAVAISIGLVRAPETHAAPGLSTGFADPFYASPNASTRAFWLDRTRATGASLVRFTVVWAGVAPIKPLNPSNPNDPLYQFASLDHAVKDAVQHGLVPVLTLTGAPSWAEGPGRPSTATAGSWKPDPGQLGEFGRALATRYAGNWPDPESPGSTLPHVKYFDAWNEPNLAVFLAPQYDGNTPVGAIFYRQMLNSFYDGVHGVRSDDVVLSGGTAPYGDDPGGQRTRPVTFWKTVLCLAGGSTLHATPCDGPAKMDVLSHHPINVSASPSVSADDPNDVGTPDMGRLQRLLSAAEDFHTISSGNHQLWATEFWVNTKPPDSVPGFPAPKQARYLELALYELWQGGASAAINLQVADESLNDPQQPNHAGVFNLDGSVKPSFATFRFPFVTVTQTTTKKKKKKSKKNRAAAAKKKSKKATTRILAWGKAPVGGTLTIQRQSGSSWLPVASLKVDAGEVFAKYLKPPKSKKKTKGKKKAKNPVYRAVVGPETSLPWTLTD
jgi:hypothetical protein